MKIQIISLFPEMFPAVLNTSMMQKAQNIEAVSFDYINLRDFGLGPRKQVDDTPYGGGDGMLLMIEPLIKAVEFAKSKDNTAQVVLMTPKGSTWNQQKAKQFSLSKTGLIIICARYEGYDERITSIVDKQISIGDFVLTGGELPAMVMIDSIVRLLPNVLGGKNSAEIESFSETNTFEYPQYTRPEVYKGLEVPPVLLSGNHNEIAKWRSANSRKKKN